MNNLLQRTISGIIYLIVIIGSLFLGKYAFGTLFLVIGILALVEFHNMMGYRKFETLSIISQLTGAAVFMLFFLVASGMLRPVFGGIIAIFPVLLLITGLYLKRENIIKDISWLFLGLIYISAPMALASFLAFPEVSGHNYTHRLILGILALVWVSDTGAYITGMLLGKHRLFPRISPKKSWEGLAGGTFFTIFAAAWMDRLIGILTKTDWTALAVIVCVFGVYGDLTESLIKRNAQVKDSGDLIPGHGGVLDRFDSMLFVIPAAVLYLALK